MQKNIDNAAKNYCGAGTQCASGTATPIWLFCNNGKRICTGKHINSASSLYKTRKQLKKK